MARIASGFISRRLPDRYPRLTAHRLRLDRFIRAPPYPPSLLRTDCFHHGLHLYRRPGIVRLLGIPPGRHSDFLFLLLSQGRHGKCQLLVRTAGDSSHADLRRYFILHFLLRTDPREEPHEDTLSPAKCLPRIIITDGSAFHPYPRRFHRIDHELKQSIFQLRPTDEPCRH